MVDNQQKSIDIAITVLGIIIFGVAFKKLAWPHLSPLIVSFFTAPSGESAPLIKSLVPFGIKIDGNIVAESGYSKELLIVKENALDAWRKLGFDLSPDETFSLLTLKKKYRERILDTHPDKTGKDTNKEFIEVRTALKQILESQKITYTLFHFGKENLFSMFTPNGYVASTLLSKELAQWEKTCQDYLQALNTHMKSQNELIKVQQSCLVEGEKYNNVLDGAVQRLDNLEAQKFSLANSLYQFLPPVKTHRIPTEQSASHVDLQSKGAIF